MNNFNCLSFKLAWLHFSSCFFLLICCLHCFIAVVLKFCIALSFLPQDIVRLNVILPAAKYLCLFLHKTSFYKKESTALTLFTLRMLFLVYFFPSYLFPMTQDAFFDVFFEMFLELKVTIFRRYRASTVILTIKTQHNL